MMMEKERKWGGWPRGEETQSMGWGPESRVGRWQERQEVGKCGWGQGSREESGRRK